MPNLLSNSRPLVSGPFLSLKAISRELHDSRVSRLLYFTLSKWSVCKERNDLPLLDVQANSVASFLTILRLDLLDQMHVNFMLDTKDVSNKIHHLLHREKWLTKLT